MTVKELKKALEGVADDTEVWVTVWSLGYEQVHTARLDRESVESWGIQLVGEKPRTWRWNHE